MHDANDNVITLRTWIESITNNDFKVLVRDCHDKAEDIEVAHEKIVLKISEDDDTIVYADGSKYVGNIEDGRPHGLGQLLQPDDRILRYNINISLRIFSQKVTNFRGPFLNGKLEGIVEEIDPQDSSIRETTYKKGRPCGVYRHKRLDGQLLAYGTIHGTIRVGPQLIVGSGGNSYFLGHVDSRDKLDGEVTFLYPCLYLAIVGQYKSGKLVSGHYRTLASSKISDGFINLTFTDNIGREVLYDPPSCFSISSYPLGKHICYSNFIPRGFTYIFQWLTSMKMRQCMSACQEWKELAKDCSPRGIYSLETWFLCSVEPRFTKTVTRSLSSLVTRSGPTSDWLLTNLLISMWDLNIVCALNTGRENSIRISNVFNLFIEGQHLVTRLVMTLTWRTLHFKSLSILGLAGSCRWWPRETLPRMRRCLWATTIVSAWPRTGIRSSGSDTVSPGDGPEPR